MGEWQREKGWSDRPTDSKEQKERQIDGRAPFPSQRGHVCIGSVFCNPTKQYDTTYIKQTI